MELTAILSGNAYPVTKDTRLQIDTWKGIIGNVTMRMKAVTMLPDGSLTETVESFIVNNSGFPNTNRFRLADGHLISVELAATGGSTIAGDLYADIGLIQGNVNDESRYTMLTCGYILNSASLTYPLSPPKTFADIDPSQYYDGMPTPAAGAELDHTFDAGLLTNIVGGRFRLVTSATVANRTVTFVVNIAGTLIYQVTSRTAQTASQTVDYILWHGPNMPADTATTFYLPLMDDLAVEDMDVATSTANIQVGDQFSLPRLYVRHRIVAQ